MENDIKQTENEFVKKALVLAMDNEHSTISVDKINAMYNQLHAAKCYTTRYILGLVGVYVPESIK